ncbi:hypothetical protein HDV05_007913, partial [Chytridiales sp. JEL 0842]
MPRVTAAALALLACFAGSITAQSAPEIPQLTVNGSLWLPSFLPAEDLRNPAANGTDGFATLKTVDLKFTPKEFSILDPPVLTIQLLCDFTGQLLRLAVPGPSWRRVSSDDRNYVIASNETQVFYITSD